MTKAGKKEKLRYIEVYWCMENNMDQHQQPTAMDIYRLISYQLRQLFGLEGSVETGLYMVSDKNHRSRMIIRCSHKHVNKLLAAVAICDNYYNKKLVVFSKRVSGILNKLKG